MNLLWITAGVLLGFIAGISVGSAMKDNYYRDQARQFINKQLWRIKLGEITPRDIDYI